MPHDAALFATSVKPEKTPEETAERVQDEVDDARAGYKSGAESSYEQYRYLTTGVAADATPTVTGFSPATAPADLTPGNVTITVIGTAFTATSVVNFDGTDRATTFTDSTHVAVTVLANTEVEGVPVFVKNGDLRSNVKNFPWTTPVVLDDQGADAPDMSWLKADIVAWLQERGVDLDEDALNSLNKSELLELAENLLTPADD